MANFGTKNGLAYQDWVSDVKTATEQVDELMVCVIEWIDRQNTLEDVTVAEFHRWANGSGHNQLELGVVAEAALLLHERSWRQRYRACRSKQRQPQKCTSLDTSSGPRRWLDLEQAGGVAVGTEQLQADSIFRGLDDCLAEVGAQGS